MKLEGNKSGIKSSNRENVLNGDSGIFMLGRQPCRHIYERFVISHDDYCSCSQYLLPFTLNVIYSNHFLMHGVIVSY